MNLKDTKTEKNLHTAVKNEAFAMVKYMFFAKKAKSEGYEQISKIFEQTANNEKEHAKIWFKILEGGTIKSTVNNLKNCIENEGYEYTTMYPSFAKTAQEEGFEEISELFKKVSEIEFTHKTRYEKLLKNIENNEVFKKNTEQIWECEKCGHTEQSNEAPECCPVCKHGREYFFIQESNF